MGKITELAGKVAALLLKINTAVDSKLDSDGTAVNSDKLGSKSLAEVRDLAKNDTLAQVASDQADIKGSAGDIAVFTETGTVMALGSDSLIRLINVVSNDTDLATAKASSTPFSEIFNKWPRFSHATAGAFPANTSELDGWEYNSLADEIRSTINSATYIGIVSNDLFENYTFNSLVKSTAADDDIIGLVLAFTKVGTREYTFSVVINAQAATATIAVNYAQGAAWGMQSIAVLPLGLTPSNWNTGDYVDGLQIQAKRTNGVFEVRVLKANSDQLPTPAYWTGNVPAQFSGPCAIGFSASSQTASSWKVSKMPVTHRDIIDTRDHHVHRYIESTESWSDLGPYNGSQQILTPNRVYKNVFGSPYGSYLLGPDRNLYVLGAASQLAL